MSVLSSSADDEIRELRQENAHLRLLIEHVRTSITTAIETNDSFLMESVVHEIAEIIR